MSEVKLTWIAHSDLPIIIDDPALRCPICDAQIVVEDILEYGDDGRVEEEAIHINCTTEPDIASSEWYEWQGDHWSMPYVDWLPLAAPVQKWFDQRYRFR